MFPSRILQRDFLIVIDAEINHVHCQLKGSEAKWANPELNVGNCLKSSKMD